MSHSLEEHQLSALKQLGVIPTPPRPKFLAVGAGTPVPTELRTVTNATAGFEYVDPLVGPGLTATATWKMLLKKLLAFGHTSSPRGQTTRELLAVQMHINMNYPCVYSRPRKVSPKFACGETSWYLQGRNDLKFIQQFAPRYDRFSDDGVTLFGAYGPQIVAQLPYVVDCLQRDTDSRQAVMTLWHQSPPTSKDIPCTISSQFIIRQSMSSAPRLHLIHSMRSNDAWVGFIYDVFSFSMLAAVVALQLRSRGVRVQLGNLIFTAGSQHIYERNVEGASKVLLAEHPGVVMQTPKFAIDQYADADHLIRVLDRVSDDPSIESPDTAIRHWLDYHTDP